jgi:uncharacterized membrane protein YdjX (TVP38/TMEM64 family)
VRPAPAALPTVYIARMTTSSPRADRPPSLTRRLIPLVAIILLAMVAYLALGRGMISLEALVRHRAAVDAFVTAHSVLAVLAFIGLYVVTVALSLPGATVLTIAGGFLFGIAIGATASVVGATTGATIIFLIARTALGEPLLRCAGARANQLAQGFREDAFSYLLFLRLVPAFPFFLVNLVPAFAAVRLSTFVAATALGIIPCALVYAFTGIGLNSIIAAQQQAYDSCLAAGRADCHLTFNANDVLTPELIGSMIALGVLALLPALIKRLWARSRAAM